MRNGVLRGPEAAIRRHAVSSLLLLPSYAAKRRWADDSQGVESALAKVNGGREAGA